MKQTVLATVLIVLLAMSVVSVVAAAAPPDRIHYQGVLRDSADNPLDGTHDMVFRFFDADIGGNEVFVDKHIVLNNMAVTVSGGLFGVDLGTGAVDDGGGPGTYLSLTEVFRDHSAIWVSIEVDFEVLSPRVEVNSSAYALNADHLDGIDSTSFLTSETDPQVGSLAKYAVPSWTGAALTEGNLYNKAGQLGIGTTAPSAMLDVAGDVRMDGDLTVAGNDISFGVPDAAIRAGTGQFNIQAGDIGTDLSLQTGYSLADGRILIRAAGSMVLTAGDGNFYFEAGNAGGTRAQLNPSGDLQIDGSLDIDGQFIEGPPAANFEISSFSSLHLQANAHVRTMIDDDANSSGARAYWYSNGLYNTTGQIADLHENGNFRVGGTLSPNIAFDIAESFIASEPLEPGDVVRLDPTRAGAVLRSTGEADTFVLGVISSKPGVLLGSAPFSPASLREVWGEDIADRFENSSELLRTAVVASYPELGIQLDTQNELEAAFIAQALEPADLADNSVASDTPSEDQIRTLRAELENDIESLSLEHFFEELFVPVALAGRVPVKVDASVVPIQPGDELSSGPTPGIAIKADGSGPVIGTALEGLADGLGKVLTFVHRGSGAGTRQITELVERMPEPVTGIQTMPGNLQIVLDADSDQRSRFSVFRDGDGESIEAEVMRVDEQGDLYLKGSVRPASMDVAEYFPLSVAAEPGDVLVADLQHPGNFRPATIAADRAVVGVVATQPGVLLGSGVERITGVDPSLAAELEQARRRGDTGLEAEIWQTLKRRFERTHAAVALTGTVDVKVDAGYGAIRIGDLLMSSPTPGHAMRANDPTAGTILGKALEPLDAGSGRIRMLVMLR